MDNWNEEIDLEAILREYGGEQDVTFPEPEADAAEAAEPKFEFPHEIGERGEPDFDAFNLSFDTEPETCASILRAPRQTRRTRTT